MFSATMRTICLTVILSLMLFSSASVAVAQEDSSDELERLLDDLSIEQLLDLEVTSVSKKAQSILGAAAAITVLTQEDIRRSGATSIAEALRLVPGMQVARANSNSWAISSRGFNQRFANKLLVVIDGRTVYTPVFSGIFWDAQDVVFSEIERIEVIRGPGATLWGANAVNGIINIITKHSEDSQGATATVGGGTEEQVFGNGRYGGKIGENTTYRVSGKYVLRDDFDQPDSSTSADDDWATGRVGARIDTKPDEDNEFTVQADAYWLEENQSVTRATFSAPFSETAIDDQKAYGTNILGRWSRTLSEESDFQFQMYYDRIGRNAQSNVDQDRDTIDLDFQHRFPLMENNEIIWGAGYRFYHDVLEGGLVDGITFIEDDENFNLFSWFIQDEQTALNDKLSLIVGSKFEVNDFTGFEFQPNARVRFSPSEKTAVWAAVSRAVRTPSRVEDASTAPFLSTPDPTGSGLVSIIAATGNKNLDAEELLAYEIGARGQLLDNLSVDVAAFFNDYKNFIGTSLGTPMMAVNDDGLPFILSPALFTNDAEAEAYGVEVSVDYRPLDWWRLTGAYWYLNVDFEANGGLDTGSQDGASPDHQFYIRSQMDLTEDIEFDTIVRYVDELEVPAVDSYTEVDVRLAWHALPNVTLAVVGQNLVDDHVEFVDDFNRILPAEISRSVYGQVTVDFN